ncbi:MAG: GxxExxY protein [Deltaproteobacteria bacterium]|nr:GxxExxY protein [Deltaproteobacteria bacterium]
MLHEDLTRQIIGAGMTVLSELRPGLLEKLYENALILELTARNHRVDQQRSFSVHYRGHFIGRLATDLIVDDAVVVDTKAVTDFNQAHVSQMLGYLNITGLRVGLLLNFGRASLQWKRIVL